MCPRKQLHACCEPPVLHPQAQQAHGSVLQNNEKQRVFSARCRAMAQAMPKPSDVDVPRPSSSTITSDRSVAVLRMLAASSISAMKVEIPRSCVSDAPTRHITESK